MNARPAGCVQPFFLKAGRGERYCLYHAPAGPAGPTGSRGAIVYVHPFAEELNKSRRMAALQARAFAAAGYGVLQIDLYGCGDSSGDFADARWAIWRDDLALACTWLQARVAGPLQLWGLRLGALLALDWACSGAAPPQGLLLWQPVLQGRGHLNQFLRMHQAARMLGGGADTADTAESADGSVEVAGYTLAPALAGAITALDAAALTPPCPVRWLELLSGPGPAGPPALPPAAARQLGLWRAAGVAVQAQAVRAPAFWGSTEIIDCPELIAATMALEPA